MLISPRCVSPSQDFSFVGQVVIGECIVSTMHWASCVAATTGISVRIRLQRVHPTFLRHA